MGKGGLPGDRPTRPRCGPRGRSPPGVWCGFRANAVLTQVRDAQVCWGALSRVSVCLSIFSGSPALTVAACQLHRGTRGGRQCLGAPPPVPHFWLRFLSARPISKGHSVTRSPVVSGPDGDPGPENPGPATAGTTRFCLGDLTGCWVPGSHGQAASPLRGLALWPGVLCVLGQGLGWPPAWLPKGRSWEKGDLGGQRVQPLPVGLPGPTDGAQPGPPPTPGWKQEQPLRVRTGEKLDALGSGGQHVTGRRR